MESSCCLLFKEKICTVLYCTVLYCTVLYNYDDGSNECFVCRVEQGKDNNQIQVLEAKIASLEDKLDLILAKFK